MARLRRLAGGLGALLRRRRVEEELDEELHAYLDAAIEERMRAGMTYGDAVRAARARMGSLDAVKDHTRDAGWETLVDSVWRDLRYAARRLRHAPGFSLVAITILALGIGANTAIFGAIDAIMLRELPVPRAHELVSLTTLYRNGEEPLFSYAAYRAFATAGADLVAAIGASSIRREAVALDALPETVDLQWVSGNYFTALDVPASYGRTLPVVDARPGTAEPVAVISDAFWARRFARDRAVLGRTFRFRTATFTIIGVAARGFTGESMGEGADLWLPIEAQPGAPASTWNGHSTTWLRVLARRRPGVTLEHAHAGLDAIYTRVRDDIAAETESAEFRASTRASRLAVLPASRGTSRLRDNLSTPLLILMAFVGLVLLVACANLANLMLARAATRQREAAVCLALGAGRARVARQRLAEALLLALVGAAGGVLLAFWGVAALQRFITSAFPIALDLAPDLGVLGFALAAACLTAVLCGVWPAVRAAHVDPLPTLKAGSAPGRPRLPFGRTLVVVQIAVSLVLLVGAALLVRSLVGLQRIDTGFDPDRVLLFRLTPPAGDPALTPEHRRELYRALVARAEQVPGVEGASAALTGVFSRGTWRNAIAVEGLEPRGGATPRSWANAVSPSYFSVMRIAVLRGRAFNEDDREQSTRVAIVSETFARQFLGADTASASSSAGGRDGSSSRPMSSQSPPGNSAIGRRVALCTSDPCAPSVPMMEIVGVAEDAKYVDLREEARPMLYVPAAQVEQNLREVQVRTVGDPAWIADALHRELASFDSRMAVVAMTDARTHVDASIVGERLAAMLTSVFGLLALALAAVGLYGLVAYVTSQRTAEIGIRMALGASRMQVRALVLRDTLTLLAIGAGLGIPVALAVARLIARQLYDVGPADPLALALSLTTFTGAALLAGYVPARRASRVDPVRALRTE